MAYANNMTKLLNKIERRLGTRPLNLPDELKKENWAHVIEEDTLDTFSRYFPNKFRMTLSNDNKKNGSDYYLIDEDLLPGDVTIIGIKDFAWDNNDSAIMNQGVYGFEDYFNNSWSLEDISMVQIAADQTSLFNNGLFPEFIPPNKVYLKNASNRSVNFASFQIDVFIKHSTNLNTIEPTKMEILESLATSDVANFLYQELKYYDNLETVFGNTELKLDDLQNAAQNRETIVETIKDNYVSAANTNQPLIYTI